MQTRRPVRAIVVGLVACFALLPACTGKIGHGGSGAGAGAPSSGGGGGTGSPPGGSGGSAGGSAVPPGGGGGSSGLPANSSGFGTVPISETGAKAISRLTFTQFLNSAAALMGDAAVAGADQLLTLREDWTGPAYSNAGFNQATGKHNIQDFDDAATYIVEHVPAWPAFHARWGGCVQSSCINTFLGRFLEAAFRRPVTDADVQAFKPILDAGATASLTYDETVKLIVRATLQAAEFIYLFQDANLNEFQLASRLSYFVTDGPPDAELYAAAKAGTLRTTNVLGQQVDRLLGASSGRFARAFARDYFELNVTFLRAGDRETQRQLVNSAIESFAASVEQKKPVDFIMTADSFIVNDATSTWLGYPAMSKLVMPSSQYPFLGMMTHPAVLMAISNEQTGSTISRGLALSEQFLCVAPPPNPPPGIQAKQEDFNLPVDATARAKAEARLGSPTCVGCHAQFEPFSFALNHWGGDGRYQGDSRLNDNGPITTVLGTITFKDYREFLQKVAQSDQFQNCIAEHVTRYGLQHTMFKADLRTAVVAAARQSSGGALTFQALIKALVLQPVFSQR